MSGAPIPSALLERDRQAYRELARLARERELFEGQPGFYAWRVGIVLGLYALPIGALPMLRDAPVFLVVAAVLLAFAFGQISFLGHDAAHRQIVASPRGNDLLSLVFFNLLLGTSLAWWRAHHDEHHVHPNDPSRDPDLRNPILAFAPDHALDKRGLPRWITRHQALLFFPLLLLEGLNIRCRAIRVVAAGGIPHRRVESALMGVHLIGFHGYVLLVLGPAMGVAFLALHLALTGLYVGFVFAPNHTGMPVLDGAEPVGRLRRQVITARNVRGNRLLDFCYGGLNFQIEHHLFPRMPRGRLRRARSLVKSHCSALGIPYHETGFLRSISETLAGLHRASASLRAPRRS